MDHVVDPIPVPTEIIRTPAAGPAPANTLAFLRCRGSGADIQLGSDGLVRFEIEFKSKFKIDGFLQQKHDWYLNNTLVSATGMIRLLNAVTDLEFLFAMDTVDPFIDLDGGLGFNCQVGLQIGGLGLREKGEIDFSFNISAYVLLYEPRADLPPSGSARQTWRHNPNEYVLQKIRPSGKIKSVGDRSGVALSIRQSSIERTGDGYARSFLGKSLHSKGEVGSNDNSCG